LPRKSNQDKHYNTQKNIKQTLALQKKDYLTNWGAEQEVVETSVL
jgi:hypothetical protein